MGRFSRREILGGILAGSAGVVSMVLARIGLNDARAQELYSRFFPFVTKGYQPSTPTATGTSSPTATMTAPSTASPSSSATGTSTSQATDTATAASTATSTATSQATGTATATATPGNSSPIYRVDNVPSLNWGIGDVSATHPGIEALLDLMGVNGLAFYRGSSGGQRCSLNGIIGKSDVIVLKVNAQWNQRGMTNTDVVRGIIRSIINHPDGFTGEIVIADNGQVGSNLNSPNQNNDEYSGHNQSFQSVANLLAGAGYAVSVFDWIPLSTAVSEFDQGDNQNGYVMAGAYPQSYPKFTTSRGTRVSTRLGIWDGAAYHPEQLKVINVPVLKMHWIFGGTSVTKNYVGLLSRNVGLNQVNYQNPPWNGDSAGPLHTNITQDLTGTGGTSPAGVLGTVLGYCYPALNIVDAIYVSPNGNTSFDATYAQTPRQATLLSGLDPIALDYYAFKYVLLPLVVAAGRSTVYADPDDPNSICRPYLLKSQLRLQAAGKTARFGEGGYTLLNYRIP